VRQRGGGRELDVVEQQRELGQFLVKLKFRWWRRFMVSIAPDSQVAAIKL
jgi:hypothetical protein